MKVSYTPINKCSSFWTWLRWDWWYWNYDNSKKLHCWRIFGLTKDIEPKDIGFKRWNKIRE